MNVEGKDPSLAGSGFSAGVIALSAGAGLLVGALGTGLAVSVVGKKKRREGM